jgi:hypothetical protein
MKRLKRTIINHGQGSLAPAEIRIEDLSNKIWSVTGTPV